MLYRSRKAAILAACDKAERTGEQQFVIHNSGREWELSYWPPAYGPFYGPIRKTNANAYREVYQER